ncbi:MAG: MFS transporter, partial [Acidimicrobiia bacterium]|nr:MFS transporter [Acidimicrobiia bacterium]
MSSVKNDRRTIFGWTMYDWANSAYSTTIAGAILPAYFADSIVPEGGYEVFGWSLSGESLWGLVVGFGAFFLFLVTPVLGAIADFSASKKRFLVFFAYGGAVFT